MFILVISQYGNVGEYPNEAEGACGIVFDDAGRYN